MWGVVPGIIFEPDLFASEEEIKEREAQRKERKRQR